MERENNKDEKQVVKSFCVLPCCSLPSLVPNPQSQRYHERLTPRYRGFDQRSHVASTRVVLTSSDPVYSYRLQSSEKGNQALFDEKI